MLNKIKSLYTLFIIKLLINKYKYILNEQIDIYINGNITTMVLPIENDSTIKFYNIIYGCGKLFGILVCYNCINENNNYIKYTYKLLNILQTEFIEVELFDNITKQSCGFSNDKLEYIKEFCKLNNCFYKIM